jgi:hypothetical protein
MHAFLTAHLKPILTAGFVIGFLSLMIRILDARLSQKHKDRFSQWVQDSAPKLRSTNLTAIFLWTRSHKILITVLYVIAIMIVELWMVGWNSLVLPTLAFVFMSSAAGLYTLSAPSLRKALIRSIWVTASLLLTAMLGIYLWIGVTYGSYYPDDAENAYETLFLVVAFWIGANVIVFLVVPFFVILVFRPPIILLGRGMFWLSTYPKGAWDGFVFALTIALGALRLFI